MQPTAEQARIQSLDVLRGFALLGILLLNIVGFGLLSTAYSNPGTAMQTVADISVWAGIELFAEGAMRCLFSILFGAGVLLFTTGERAKSAAIHYKRNFWLLLFGLFDIFILLWTGDVLFVYALVGFLLYTARNSSPRRLLVCAGILLALIALMHAGMNYGMRMAQSAAQEVATAPDAESISQETKELAAGYTDFVSGYELDTEAQGEELMARSTSYISAFKWTLDEGAEYLLFVVPVFLFWDALAMMLIGMALFKLGVLQGERSTGFYVRLMLFGFLVGITVNGYEVHKAITSDFEVLSVFAQMQWTYHFGRLGTALGWLGLIILLLHKGVMQQVAARLAAVGRMALTNYLMHSFLCLVLFTGLGFGLVGQFSRFELYGVVIAIWIFQLWLSPWWLERYKFGPMEWLWRWLTYGSVPANKRF